MKRKPANLALASKGAESINADCTTAEVRIASMILRRQVERWENEGGAQRERPGFDPTGKDLEAIKAYGEAKRSQLLTDYAKPGKVGTR